MSNRSVGVRSIHGGDPQFIIPTIVRHKIYETTYWKDRCFGLNAATIIDQAQLITEIGTTYGDFDNPTHFICLILKLLQIQPELAIIMQFIEQELNKYLRILAAVYLRLTERSAVIYTSLEPLYSDYRRIRVRDKSGTYHILHVDEVIDGLLNDTSFYGLPLPRITKREILVKNNVIQPRISLLEVDIDEHMPNIMQHNVSTINEITHEAPDHPPMASSYEQSSSSAHITNQLDQLHHVSVDDDGERVSSDRLHDSISASNRSRRRSRSLSSDARREYRYRSHSRERRRDSSSHRSHQSYESRSHRDVSGSRRHRERSSRYRSSSRSRSRSRSPKRSRHSRR